MVVVLWTVKVSTTRVLGTIGQRVTRLGFDLLNILHWGILETHYLNAIARVHLLILLVAVAMCHARGSYKE